jgi:YD repeat-containing protein
VSRTTGQWRELARTSNDGATAVLLWDRSSNRVRVTLSDERLCHYVDFEVRLAARLERVSALDSRIADREEA